MLKFNIILAAVKKCSVIDRSFDFAGVGVKYELPNGERGQFSENHLQSVTLPSRYHTDKGIYRLEMERIHQRSWSYVGHLSDVAKPGQYFMDYIAGQHIAWMGWPHLSILSLPGSKNLLVLRMAPNGPVDPKLDAVKELFMDNFNQEDIAIVESVQRGISSLGFDQGRYVCDPDDSWFSEVPLHTFHTQVLEALVET